MEAQALIDLTVSMGGRVECVMCTENDGKKWVAIGELPTLSEMILPLFPGDSSGTLVNQGHLVYGMSCGNCGFVRLVSIDAIEAAMLLGH
jgi:hypothetical protein